MYSCSWRLRETELNVTKVCFQNICSNSRLPISMLPRMKVGKCSSWLNIQGNKVYRNPFWLVGLIHKLILMRSKISEVTQEEQTSNNALIWFGFYCNGFAVWNISWIFVSCLPIQALCLFSCYSWLSCTNVWFRMRKPWLVECSDDWPILMVGYDLLCGPTGICLVQLFCHCGTVLLHRDKLSSLSIEPHICKRMHYEVDLLPCFWEGRSD